MREQRERLERRQASGERGRREANQAKLLLGRQQERSEGSAGKLRQQQDAARERLAQAVRDAAGQVERAAEITVHTVPQQRAAPRALFTLDAVELPFAPQATRRISLSLGAGRRIGVIGANGCGKSTLLKVLAGQLPPRAGGSASRRSAPIWIRTWPGWAGAARRSSCWRLIPPPGKAGCACCWPSWAWTLNRPRGPATSSAAASG